MQLYYQQIKKQSCIKGRSVERSIFLSMDNEELYLLVARYIDGDDYAFTTLYNLTKNKVFANIYSYVRSEAIAEDILSETYVNFINNIHKIKKDQSILGLLYVISRNLSLNYIKKHKKEEFLEDQNIVVSKDEGIKSSLDYQDIILTMKKVLNEDMFKVVMMRLVLEMEYSEISSLLKRKESTIRWMYAEGIKKIKEELYVR